MEAESEARIEREPAQNARGGVPAEGMGVGLGYRSM